MPGGKIFISYRRADSQWAASRLYDSLIQVFPHESIFMDVDSIDPGQDFVDVLAEKVGSADVFLALIGPDWLTEKTVAGERRIDDEADFVRVEIASALSQESTVVIPVLLDGAKPPTDANLPPSLRPLARRHFARLTHEGYRGEVGRLIDGIGKALDVAPNAPPPMPDPPASLPPPRTPRGPILTKRQGLSFLAAALVLAGVAAAIWTAIQPPDPSGTPDLEVFRECEACPEMVVIPAGAFVMGSPEGEANRRPQEGPTRDVTVGRFALAKTEVTFAEWDACVAVGGCGDFRPTDGGLGREGVPAFNLSWNDAQAYIAWLNDQVPGDPYRLPSEAEWEYAARAGTTTPYYWGDAPDRTQANMGREICCIGAAEGADTWVGAAPVAQFPPNAFGLYDMAGNLWEWAADVYRDSYAGAPSDGGEWVLDPMTGRERRVLRGGGYKDRPWMVRAAARLSNDPNWRLGEYGFRPARDLTSQ